MMGIAQQIVGTVCVHLSRNQVLQDLELRGHDRAAAKDLDQKFGKPLEISSVQIACEKLLLLHELERERLVAAAFVDHGFRSMRKTGMAYVVQQARQTDKLSCDGQGFPTKLNDLLEIPLQQF